MRQRNTAIVTSTLMTVLGACSQGSTNPAPTPAQSTAPVDLQTTLGVSPTEAGTSPTGATPLEHPATSRPDAPVTSASNGPTETTTLVGTTDGNTTTTSVSPAGSSAPSTFGSEATNDNSQGLPDSSNTPALDSTSEVSTRPERPARVLLYHFSTLDIPSVPQQLTILTTKLSSWGYEVDTSEQPSVFSDQNLENYAAVGMINTCFSPFGSNNDGSAEGQVLQRFLREGGGLFGIHCADVTFQSVDPPPLYNQLLGGRASSMNFEGLNQCRKVAEHPTTQGLPETFSYDGNLDGTNFIADDSEVLVKCKWDDGNGQDVAVSWVRNEGLGRVFFSNFAKVDTDLTNPTVGDPHLIAGLSWVLGL